MRVLERIDAPHLPAPVPPPSRSPVRVYLARLAPGSQPAMRQALVAIAAILAPGVPLEAVPWHQLRYPHTQALRAVLAARYAPATANRMLSALRGTLVEARRLGHLSADDYVAATDVARVRGSRILRGRALAAGELRALFEAASPRDAALLAVLYGGGLRRAEAVALDVDDYDPATGALKVRGKGDKERTVWLTGGATAALSAWLTVRGHEPGALFWSHHRGHLGERLTPAGIRTVLRALAVQAKVAAFSPHDVRRTFVSDLLDAGADIAAVQALAGHASPATTTRYDRRGERARRHAAGLLHVPFTA